MAVDYDVAMVNTEGGDLPTLPPPKRTRRWPWIVGGVLGAFLLLFVGLFAFAWQQFGVSDFNNVRSVDTTVFTTTIPVSAPFDDYEAADRACDRLHGTNVMTELAAEVEAIQADDLDGMVVKTCPTEWSRAVNAAEAIAPRTTVPSTTPDTCCAIEPTTVPSTTPTSAPATKPSVVVGEGERNDMFVSPNEARQIKSALNTDYPTVAAGITPMELNSLAQKSCALVAASTTSDEWLGLLNTHVVPTIVHLDPDPATDDGTWLKQTVVYAADAACEADLSRVLDA